MPNVVPPWLDAPPEGTMAPPTHTRLQELPFDKLRWIDFERLALSLIRQQSTIVDCDLYGKPGQAQEGIDMLALREGQEKATCYQCKRVTDATPALVRNSVDKFLGGSWTEGASQFVLCVAAPMNSTQIQREVLTQKQRLRAIDVAFHLWDASPSGRFVELLKANPQIVDDFFGRDWVKLFNGKDAADSLKDRLDNSDAIVLRRRLHDLYGVIFDQHDPGPPKPLDRDKASYLQRYAPIDVVEQGRRHDSEHAGVGTQGPEPADNSAGQFSDDLAAYRHATAADDETRNEIEARKSHPLVATESSDEVSLPVFEWLADKHKCLVLGDPGSGKSTLLRFLALYLVSANRQDQSLLPPTALKMFPIWMSFARYSAAIRDAPNTSVKDYFNQWLHEHSFDDVKPMFERALRHSEGFLLVDGLDEAVDAKHGREAMDRIVAFSRSVDAMIVCTGRPAARPRFAIPDEWNSAIIAPMRDTQVHELAKRWFIATEFGNVEDTGTGHQHSHADNRATRFLRAAKASPRTNTLVRNPMLCRAMIQLYQSSHRLPVARARIYDDIIELLLSRHPAARAHAAMTETPAELLDLNTDDLREMLVRLASGIQRGSDVDVGPRGKCYEICARFLEDETEGPGLAKPVAKQLARTALEYLTVDFGLLVEKGADMLGFVHLSIQEHLAAEHVTRMAEEDQRSWLSDVWQSRKWRECVTDWFAIQGLRGNRRLTGIAAKHLRDLGDAGEWQRMQSLELRTELACADIGLPVGLSRTIIAEAGQAVSDSPHTSHRAAIARSVTLGALSSQLRETCAPWVTRWLPGRPHTRRASLLRSFNSWAEADDLRATLMHGLQDENHECRAAAADSLHSVFSSWPELGEALQSLAESNTRPEVRAVALRSLAKNPDWRDRATSACEANSLSSSTELAFSICAARVKNGQHRDEDLQRLSRIWSNHSIEFTLRQEFVDTLCSGWPQRPSIRKSFESFLDSQRGTLYYGIPLAYLIRCYPNDNDLASRLARLFDAHGLLGCDWTLWNLLIDGYRGHPTIVPAVRRAIDDYKDRHDSMMWDPYTLPAFAVIGDNAVRDELVEAYAGPETQDWDRYWIAHTLITNWPNDQRVVASMRTWASLGADFAATLAPWADKIHEEPRHRRDWLTELVEQASPKVVISPMQALLDAFPDEEARVRVQARSSDEGIWYYHQIRIRALLARCFPAHPSSDKTVKDALSQIDGPPLGELSVAYEDHDRLRTEFLRASVTAPEDVRNTVAATLRDHAFDLRTVETLSPNLLAEASPSVRTTIFAARARIAKSESSAAEALSVILATELSSLGTFYKMRRLSSLAGLLELGRVNSAIGILTKNRSFDLGGHLSPLENYSAAIAVIVEHWSSLQPLLEDAGLDAELPIKNLLEAGYGSLVGQSKAGQVALDLYLQAPHDGVPSRRELQQLARRFPRSNRLRDELLAALARRSREPGADFYVAQLLMEHFKDDLPTLTSAAAQLRASSGIFHSLEPSAISLLRFGWPDDIRHCMPDHSDLDMANLTNRDRLLRAIADQDGEAAQRFAESMVLDLTHDWRYRQDDQHALRLWSRQPSAQSVLERWCKSENGTLAVTGLALSSPWTLGTRAQLDRLIDRFNRQSSNNLATPTDGLDATTGLMIGWNVKALDVVRSLH